jgi:HSP20 family protein
MAKISKKPPVYTPTIEGINMLQFIAEDMEDMLTHPGVDTVNHIPPVDMFSTSETLVLEVEMPGVRQEDIDIAFFNNILTIKGMKYECFKENKVNYVCMERGFGKLFRSIKISHPVDATEIKASFKNGLLTIRLPKVGEKRGKTRKIQVESA